MSVLELDKVSKSFGGVMAVHRLSFRIEPGQVTALIGPNGAGKTTVFNLVTGIYREDEGSIRFKGQTLNGLKPSAIASRGIARTFQNLQVFENMSVAENVMTGRHIWTRSGFIQAALGLPACRRENRRCREAALRCLEEVKLADRADDNAGVLPFGQQRLLEVARAMAMEPELLLLDEPAAGLPAGESREMEKAVRRLADSGTAVLLVEHDMETVMSLADNIVVMNFGAKIAEGDPESIQKNDEVIKAYLGEDEEYA